jgi:hypothetical protein
LSVFVRFLSDFSQVSDFFFVSFCILYLILGIFIVPCVLFNGFDAS